MRKLLIISLFLLGLTLPILVSAATPTNQTGVYPEMDIDIWVDGWDNYYIYYTSLDTSDTIYVEFEVTSGSGIHFWITDDYNYDRWDLGQSNEAYVVRSSVGSLDISFDVPHSDEWRVVFYNDDLLESKHIEGYIGLSPQFIPSDPSDSFLTIVIVLFVVVACLGIISKGVKRTNKPNAAGYPPEMLPRISQEPTRPPPTSTPTNYCPYCGTPKQSSSASFCATCGRAFEGPGLG